MVCAVTLLSSDVLLLADVLACCPANTVSRWRVGFYYSVFFTDALTCSVCHIDVFSSCRADMLSYWHTDTGHASMVALVTLGW